MLGGRMSVDATKEFQIVVTNKLENLPTIAEFLSHALQQLGMKEEKIFDVNVAVDEACTNIIQNGYSPDEEGTIEIRCEAMTGNKCAILIKDHGKPFDQ